MFFWSVMLTLTRLSILFFYLRVLPFEVLPFLKRTVYITMVFVILIGIMITVPLIFQCMPLSSLWFVWTKGLQDMRCVEMQKHAWATVTGNFLSDIWLVALPIPSLLKLRLKWKKKLGVCLMFSFGGLYVLFHPVASTK
jgi:hypothetical protein